MNEYRVDRARVPVTPVGMNSLIHIGGSAINAGNVFAEARPGRDPWGRKDPAYGVLLSRWDAQRREYVVVASKGISDEVVKC